jgi:prefoldin alpha subunit
VVSVVANRSTVNLDSLSTQQLSALKKQLDEEVEHLSSSFTQLAAAQSKFKDCLRCVQTQQATSPSEKKSILVPLTNSLYVAGTLTQPDRVLVDVGTGFYVEKVQNPNLCALPPSPRTWKVHCGRC